MNDVAYVQFVIGKLTDCTIMKLKSASLSKVELL